MNAPETTDEIMKRLLLHPREGAAEPPPGIAEDEPDEGQVSDPDANGCHAD